ncbi:mitochondrial fission process protein 1 [Limosa lapponica baueri]|uniref:Mitochondrial fission process protein 1 n=1 Tax=Limosa lapponica baueri TaxID=1758121 RepID=A0A2I0TRY7_LIMLA|nr:mitochondrial fission process protein 1 [Limosa lapponica baueri]
MGNKQEELEAIVRHESYDVVAITETWWDKSNDWSAAMEGYKLFRRDRQGRRGGGVALYVREDYECVELTEGNGSVYGRTLSMMKTLAIARDSLSLQLCFYFM